jgi:hypothetical protein
MRDRLWPVVGCSCCRLQIVQSWAPSCQGRALSKSQARLANRYKGTNLDAPNRAHWLGSWFIEKFFRLMLGKRPIDSMMFTSVSNKRGTHKEDTLATIFLAYFGGIFYGLLFRRPATPLIHFLPDRY